MSKRKALGGTASDKDYAAFPYVISGLERENGLLMRDYDGRFSSQPPPQNPGIVATASYQPWRPTAALAPPISFAL